MSTNDVLDPITPGEILREDFMIPMNISINKLSRDLVVPPNRISAIVNGKRSITADTALRLERYFGVEAQFWLNLQSEHDLRMIKRKIGLPWDCQTRVSQVSKDLLEIMRKANCQQVFFGVESGCQHVLDSVKKGTTVKQNEKAIRLAKKAGLFVAVSIMVGYPGETQDMLMQTIEFIKKTEPDDAYICVATPYPGTELRKLIEENGWQMSDDWSKYDTTMPVFDNPNLSAEDVRKLRTSFYNSFYSPKYVLRQLSLNLIK